MAWSEQVLPSGVAALLVATVPLWMVVVEWLRRGGARPTGRVFFGIALGLTGVVFLVGPSRLAGSGRVDPVRAGVLIAGSICWATGSVFSRHWKLPQSTLLSTAMFSLMGGMFLLLLGVFSGQLTALDPGKISLRSLLCVAYLVVFGSLAGFSAYTYLLDKVPPARVATYGYVNPVIAVFLGWAVAGEQLTARMLVAAAVIVGAVVLVISAPHAAPTESATGQPVVPE